MHSGTSRSGSSNLDASPVKIKSIGLSGSSRKDRKITHQTDIGQNDRLDHINTDSVSAFDDGASHGIDAKSFTLEEIDQGSS